MNAAVDPDPRPDLRAYQAVMAVEPGPARSPLAEATRDFVVGQVWARPGLGHRDRRWITLTCVAAADAPQPMADQVYAALKTGEVTRDELLEFVLHFAVYCGWPKASHIEGVIRAQSARVAEENGEPDGEWTADHATLGLADWDDRIARGAEEFAEVNQVPAPEPTSPYMHAGILNFVFGHVWQRPGLDRRTRRLITVAAVALDDAPIPILAHVYGALKSGDLDKAEMDELTLQFAAYYGFAKAEALQKVVDEVWAGIATGGGMPS